MKQFLLLLWVLALLFAAQTALADGNYYPDDTYAVVCNPNANDCLNLREKPTTEAASLGKYYNGIQVRLVAEYDNAPDWVYVAIGHGKGSAEGFMMKSFLVFDQVDVIVQPVHPTYTVPAGGAQLVHLNSLMEPDTALATLPGDSKVTILGYTDKWYHVQVGGRVGYIAISGGKLPVVENPDNSGGDQVLAYPTGEGSSGGETVYPRVCAIAVENRMDRIISASLEQTAFMNYLVRVTHELSSLPNDALTSWQVTVNGRYSGDALPYWEPGDPTEPTKFLIDLGQLSSEPQSVSVTPVWEEGGVDERNTIKIK